MKAHISTYTPMRLGKKENPPKKKCWYNPEDCLASRSKRPVSWRLLPQRNAKRGHEKRRKNGTSRSQMTGLPTKGRGLARWRRVYKAHFARFGPSTGAFRLRSDSLMVNIESTLTLLHADISPIVVYIPSVKATGYVHILALAAYPGRRPISRPIGEARSPEREVSKGSMRGCPETPFLAPSWRSKWLVSAIGCEYGLFFFYSFFLFF